MSRTSAGNYILYTTDSKNGELLTGLTLLQQRLEKLLPQQDQIDIIREISKTHTIPIYSDFTQCLRISNEYTKHQSVAATVSWGSIAVFELPNIGDFWGDIALNIYVDELGREVPDAEIVNADKYYYCDLPGVRMIESTGLELGNVVIDKYTRDDVLFKYNFETDASKKVAFERAVGQEQPVKGHLYYKDQGVREERYIKNGYQTPKPYQPGLDIWIKTQFWFNESIENALCAGTTSYGQRRITFKLADVTDIIRKVDKDGNVIPFNSPTIRKCMLHVNNIFIDPLFKDIYLDNIAYNLVRRHTNTIYELNSSSSIINLSKVFKFPTEQFYIGVRPVSTATDFDTWHKFCVVNKKELPHVVARATPGSPVPTLSLEKIVYQEEVEILDNLALMINSMNIFEHSPGFFSDYLPIKKGNIVSPSKGLFYIPFNHFQLENKLSGFIDLSRIGDLMLRYVSKIIGPNNRFELVVSSRSLNFIQISSDTSGVLQLKYVL